MTVRILHNPRCSKSRATLALLQERGIEPEVCLYLESPPSTKELRSILNMLGIDARSFMRKGETEFKALGLEDPQLSEDHLVEVMVENPRLIERPIVISGKRAAIGRPPESVLKIL